MFVEVCAQEYSGNNCKFSSGFVEGHSVDTIYIRLEKDGVEPTMLLLRPDEAAAMAWCLTGVLWSDSMSKMTEGKQLMTPNDAQNEAKREADALRAALRIQEVISDFNHCAVIPGTEQLCAIILGRPELKS